MDRHREIGGSPRECLWRAQFLTDFKGKLPDVKREELCLGATFGFCSPSGKELLQPSPRSPLREAGRLRSQDRFSSDHSVQLQGVHTVTLSISSSRKSLASVSRAKHPSPLPACFLLAYTVPLRNNVSRRRRSVKRKQMHTCQPR